MPNATKGRATKPKQRAARVVATPSAPPTPPSAPSTAPTPAPSEAVRKSSPPVRAKAAPGKPKSARPSALDAAASVLAGLSASDARSGLSPRELIDRMRRARLWTSPGGKTPHATLYAAIIREIAHQRSSARFKRVAPGRFAAPGAAGAARPRKAAPADAAPSERRGRGAKPAKARASA